MAIAKGFANLFYLLNNIKISEDMKLRVKIFTGPDVVLEASAKNLNSKFSGVSILSIHLAKKVRKNELL